MQREDEVIHVLAENLADLTSLLGALAGDAHSGGNDEVRFDVQSHDFY